ncbi:MAG: CAP domain-containing protein [Propionibacteriaceae bacterium]|nr:CAP domain-containing protein [Propionibacteriaceae bacterium]
MKKVAFVTALIVSIVGAGVWLAPTPPAQAAVNRASMEDVSKAYINSFLANFNVPTGWTGNTAGCEAGTTTTAFRQSEIDIINYYRDLAGLAPVTENSAATAVAQQTALMMAAAGTLSHTPGSTWACYTADGAAGAAKSNLGWSSGALGGGQAIENYMSDEGEYNVSVGHRKWILFPPQSQFGIGHTNNTDSLVWGNSNGNAGMQDNTRTSGAVAWPPADGFFPYENLPSSGRWSYSLPNYHFNTEQVSVTKNGQSVPITIVHRETEYGIGYTPDATLVWEMPAASTTRPAAGASDLYRISVTGQPTYEVEVFSAAQVWIDSLSVTGQAEVGQTLTAQLGQVTPSAAASKVTYQWQRDGAPIEGATTAATYTLVGADAGKPITVTAQVADGAHTYQLSVFRPLVSFYGASLTSAEVTPALGAIDLSAVQITGTPQLGQTLSVNTTVAPATASLSYRWLRGSTQVGTAATYTVVSADLGQSLTVEVTATATGYNSATKTSDPITPALGTINLSSVQITGTPQPGQVLGVDMTVVPSTASLSYRWLRGATEVGTGSTYIVVADDLGQSLTVQVQASATGYANATRTSDPVTPALGTITLSLVQITGTAQLGQTLGVSTLVEPNAVSLSYRWLRGATEVGTGSSYTVVAADVGQPLTVAVQASATGYNPASSTSLAVTPLPGVIDLTSIQIAGVARPGQTLTAQVSVSPSTAALTYRWLRGSTEVGTAATYTVVAADVDQPLTVAVQASAPGYDSASSTSAQVTPALNVIDLISVQIVGQAQEGQSLQAQVSVDPTTVSLSYRWLRGSTEVGTGSSYTVVLADLGQPLTVEVQASAPGYATVSSTSAIVTPALNAIDLSAVQITGTARPGQLLSVDTTVTPTSAALSYRWLRGSTQVGTASTYTVGEADLDQPLTVEVTASATGYANATRTSAPVTPALGLIDLSAVQITGTAQLGQTLSVDTTVTPSTVSLAYRWLRGSTQIGTGATHTVVAEDVGQSLTVQVQASATGYANANLTSDPVTPAPGLIDLSSVVITGTAQLGQALGVNVTVSPTSAALSYRWLRGSTEVGTAATYTVVAADVGQPLTVAVQASAPGHTSVSSTSAAVAPDPGTIDLSAVQITGVARPGQTLTAQVSVTPSTAALSYRWLRGSTVVGTAATYTVVPADLDQSLTVEVQASATGYTSASSTSAVVTPAPGVIDLTSVQIIGQAREGQTLDAQVSVDPTTVSLSYRWLRGSTEVGTASSYTVVLADLGQPLTVEVQAAAPGYATVSSTSAPVTPALNVIDLSSVQITGTPQLGQALGVSTTVAPSTAALSYRWLRGSTEVGTAATYTVAVADVGQSLTVEVTASATGHTTATKTSAVVTPAPGLIDLTSVQITGTAQSGQTLTAQVSVTPSTASLSYRWLRGSTEVGTAASYTVVAADVDQSLTVEVQASAPGHTSASLTSAPVVVPITLADLEELVDQAADLPVLAQTDASRAVAVALVGAQDAVDQGLSGAALTDAYRALEAAVASLKADSLEHSFVGGAVFVRGSTVGLTHVSVRDLSLHTGLVSVDGVVLTAGTDYRVFAGSTVVQLEPGFLAGLSVGQHTLTVAFANGWSAETVFSVTAAGALPDTGAPAGLGRWVMVWLLAAGAVSSLALSRRLLSGHWAHAA